MRFSKLVIVSMVLCLLFVQCSICVAEDEVISVPVDLEVGESDCIGINGLFAENEEISDIEAIEDEESWAVDATIDSDFIVEGDTLVRYGGIEKNVVIPDGITSIGNNAFLDYKELESVYIPNTVTQIEGFGYGAFEGCENLRSITIPNSVTSIGSWVFCGCSSLKSISLPNNLTELGYSALADCTGLTTITFPDSMEETGERIMCGCTNLKSVHLSKNMRELNTALFANCDSLENIDFIDGVTVIGNSVFSNCNGLRNITIPNSVLSINDYAFGACKNLESVIIPDSVTFIDRTAFNDSDKVVILGSAGSYAEKYANALNIPFNAPCVSFDEKTISLYDDSVQEYVDSVILPINQVKALKANQHPANLETSLKWSSSDHKIATVDQDGNVKGVEKGIAIISAEPSNGKGKAAQIRIYVPESSCIKFLNDWGLGLSDLEITMNESLEIYTAIETPYSDKIVTDMPATFVSSNESVITITQHEKKPEDDYKLTLKGCKPGKATITATTPDNGRASMEITVVRPDPSKIKIDQDGPIYIKVGETAALSATISPKDVDPDLSKRWWASDDDVATVSKDGVVIAVAEGWTEIAVGVDNYDISDYIDVYVQPDNPTKITLNKTKATLYAGDTLSLKASLTPEETETALTWTSSKPKVAKVSAKGKVTALKAGTTTVTVTAENGKTATAKITVKALPKSVTLDKTKASLGVKDTLTLKAALKPSDTVTKLTWKSSTTSVAKVSQKGVVTALKKGTAIITVTAENGKKATAKITVKPAPSKVTLYKGSKKLKSGATLSLKKGKTLQLKAKLPSGTLSTLTWSSDKPKVAKVSKKGKVTALKKGTATITVKTANGKKAKVKIKVK